MSNDNLDFEDNDTEDVVITPDTVLAEELELIEDNEADTAPAVEEVVVPEPAAPVYEQPAPAPVYSASDEGADTILLTSCVYKNTYNQKSLTVHHVQRRLNELGYPEAYADADGYYGDLTKNAVADFQKAKGLEGEGLMTEETFAALFAGDPLVVIG